LGLANDIRIISIDVIVACYLMWRRIWSHAGGYSPRKKAEAEFYALSLICMDFRNSPVADRIRPFFALL
jgi:hypothetical protein